jgi:hypothetical protein
MFLNKEFDLAKHFQVIEGHGTVKLSITISDTSKCVESSWKNFSTTVT